MSPRWLVAVIVLALSFAATTSAQSPIIPNLGSPQGYAPTIVNNFGSDPYASVGVQPNGWLGTTPGVPYMNSVRDRLWLRAEYLHWWTEGMDLPPLVTTSPAGTPLNQAAILGEPDTSILFGGREINGNSVGGVRLNAGFWLTQQGAFGIEGEYFALGDQKDGFNAGSDGTTILGRPFFDIENGRETAQLISFPGLVSGNIAIGSKTNLRSFLINGRAALTPVQVLDGSREPDRVDWIVGYRYLDLDDSIVIAQNLTAFGGDTAASSDRFRSSNEFNGLQLGVAYQSNFRRASLESLIRVAVGNNTQSINILGSTAITESGVTENLNAGLLAQRTNIGNFERKQFTMIPELGLTLGIRVRDWLHATVGYSVLYYPSVVRAGDQIDTDVNPTLLDPNTPFTGAPRPQFRFVESDYWAQGINLGVEFRF